MAQADAQWIAVRDALLSADPADKGDRVAALDLAAAPRHPDDPDAALVGAPGRPAAPAPIHWSRRSPLRLVSPA